MSFRMRGLVAFLLLLVPANRAYGQTFQADRAEAEFKRAIEQDPDDSVSYNNYGLYLLERGKFAEALIQFRRAVDIRPENVQGIVGIGEAYRQAGQLKVAQQWYRRALQLDPNNAIARQWAAR